MATEPTPQAPPPVAPAPSGLPLKKLIIIGVPVFVVQFVLVYFLVAKFLVSAPPAGTEAVEKTEATEEESKEHGEAAQEQQLYVIKDIIINPAGTNGTRFLLMTIGFEVSNAEAKAEIERKEFQVRDILNTILSAKGLAELSTPDRREELRVEIQTKVGELVKSGKMKNVYFSKFIIQ